MEKLVKLRVGYVEVGTIIRTPEKGCVTYKTGEW